MHIILNVLLSSSLITLVLWLSKENPSLGGFIISLPISTLIVLALSKIQNGDAGNTTALAKSVFVSVPMTLLFFVPFLLADKLKLSFWTSYVIGFALLGVSYGLHKWVMTNWMS